MSGKRTAGLRAVWFASAAAILPVAALSVSPAPLAAADSAAFAPPAEPMVLTRTLRRPLPGGAEVATQRSYEISFVPDALGYIVEGKLIDVKTQVPAPFEALAALERKRGDDGMFPMRLDRNGHFLPMDEPAPADTREASKLALEKVSAFGLSPDETREASNFIGQVSKNPGRTPWPADLFNPAPGKRSDTHTIPMPGGKTGQVSIDIDARTDTASGMVAMFRRQVTTRLEGSSRVTQEIWTLHRKG